MNKRAIAIKLRRQGFSYSMIQKKVPVSQATLSQWLSSMPYTPNEEAINRARMGPIISGEKRRKAKQDNIKKSHVSAKKEIGEVTKRDLFMLGIGLYIGEGSKSLEQVRIMNSDPEVIRLGIQWLKIVGNIDAENLVIEIHGYPDIDEAKSKRFWSKVCGVPLDNFAKTQIDNRTNKSSYLKNKLPYGTIQVRVRANGDRSKGVELFRKIEGYMKAVKEASPLV